MEEINYVEYMPKEPPKAVFDYMEDVEAFSDHYIVYKKAKIKNPLTNKKEEMVRIKCAHCKGEMYVDIIKAECGRYATVPYGWFNPETKETEEDDDSVLCPMCGEGCTTKLINKGTKLVSTKHPMHVAKIKGEAALISWRLSQSIDEDANLRINAFPYEAYIFESNKAIKLKGWNQYFTSFCQLDTWEQKKRYYGEFGKCFYFVPFDRHFFDGTALENAKMYEYINGAKELYPVDYAYIYIKKHNIENLIMQGASEIVSEILRETSSSYNYYTGRYSAIGTTVKKASKYIDFKKKRPCEMLGLTKEEYRFLVKTRNLEDIEFYKEMKAKGIDIKYDKMPDFRKNSKYKIRELSEYTPKVMKCISYIERQKKKHPENAYKLDLGFMKDYLKMLTEEGKELTDERMFPPDLAYEHDKAIRRIKYKEDKKLKKKFEERFEILKELILKDEVTGLEIVPCDTPKSLYQEGKILDHCVSNYSEEHAEGRSNIFFIREIANPEQPFFTLELKVIKGNMIVSQNRGYKNCDRTSIVIEFEKKWLEHIKKLEVNINGK